MKIADCVVLVLGAGAVSCVTTARAGDVSPTEVALTTTSPAQLGTVNFEDDALVAYNPDTDVALQIFDLADETGIMRDLDAVHELPNGNLIISTQAGGTVGALDFTESDLLEIDRTTGGATMFLDASAVGLEGLNNTVANIDAVYVDGAGVIYFSVGSDDGASFLGGTIDNADVVAYDPTENDADLFFNGSLIDGNGGDPDVQAFTILDDGAILLAAINTAGGADLMTLAGQEFTRDDLVRFEPFIVDVIVGTGVPVGNASLFLEGVNEFSAPGEIIDGVTVGVVPEPAAAALLGLGGLVWSARRSRVVR